MLTVIFSKDRACQLHCLLESIFCLDKEQIFEPTVIYNYSSDIYKNAYGKCIKYWLDKYNKDKRKLSFLLESNFRNDLLHTIDNNNQYYKHSEYLMFLVDDMILMKEIKSTWNEMQQILDMPNMCCLSLRLGRNTTWQYQTNSRLSLPSFKEHGNLLWWNRFSCPTNTNFNYPLSTDSHIYKRNFIVPITKQTEFKNPNQFEANLQRFVRKCPPYMSCLNESVFVNNVINICQYEFKNKYGVDVFESLESLNEKYMQDQIIDFANMDFDSVNGCHCEIPLKWRKLDD